MLGILVHPKSTGRLSRHRHRHQAFYNCTSLTYLDIPDSVLTLGEAARGHCDAFISITFGSGVTSLGDALFFQSANLLRVYFSGNAPNPGAALFYGANSATVYRLPGTTGWGGTFAGRPVEIWGAWDAGYADIGGGWRRLDWFGDYVPMGVDGWIWHNKHGFFFIPADALPASIWLYAQDMGWLWTGSTVYPFLFRDADAAWLWYNGATISRWFVNMDTGQWESWQ
jgi:hypothetical protein